MSEKRKTKTIYSMDRLHPEAGWKAITYEVEPKLVSHIITDKSRREGYRIENRWAE